MPRSPILRAGLLICALATSLLAGCTTDGITSVTSAWPHAESERTIPRPPEFVRWPLTGLPASDPEITLARVVSVKIENSPASRPQSNLDLADVVYESLTEGSITRFNAFFHSNAPEVVGPVRSARLSDAYIVPQYGALFAHVGGNRTVIGRIKNASIDDLDQFVNPGPYWRSNARPRPHNMYTSIPALRETGTTRGYEASRDVAPFAFELLPQETTPTITQVSVPFAPGNKATWDYETERDVYTRRINGRVHGDAVSGEQYAAKNVIVLWATTSRASTRDVTGSSTLDIQLNGSGRASVFRNGRRFDGTWQTDGSRPPTFKDEAGEVIRLTPGNSWVQVVRPDTTITMK